MTRPISAPAGTSQPWIVWSLVSFLPVSWMGAHSAARLLNADRANQIGISRDAFADAGALGQHNDEVL